MEGCSVAKIGCLNRGKERERCVSVQRGNRGGGLEVERKVPLHSLSLSPQMMDSNSGENKTKHSSCCHHNETGT